ncbi:LysR family transcriptional regulator ArgP [Nocardioides sp.]|uniref:LysR family transcriptional regulator ArgP n=1 Tax=Nocardioides sp. TaxID=35761 RepID=UPI003518A0B9
MTPHPDQLAALAAIVEHGSFEAAARQLHVTTSAVSQRIRALESGTGRVLVERASPCRATPAGEALVRLARQVALVYDEAREHLGDPGPGAVVDLPVAVNADSLATWFRPVLAEVAGWDGVRLRLRVEDQGWSADHLRRGDVLAAVTSDPTPVQGCRVEPLGTLRYRPAVAPALARDRDGAGAGAGALADLPMVVFNAKDRLQHDLLRRWDLPEPAVVHEVPTSADFVAAIGAGLGWGLVPDPQLAPEIAAGRLVALDTAGAVEVPLHWQCWRLRTPTLERLSDAVRAAAGARLAPPARVDSSTPDATRGRPE